METGCRGTFAIAWSDTETDGLKGAPTGDLAVGASWIWNGRAVRIDGPQDILRLEAADGTWDLRERAARRLLRLARGPAAAPDRGDGGLETEGPLSEGFTVTDGRRQYAVAVLRDGTGSARLAAFPAGMPPPGCELWVTQLALREPSPGTSAAGEGVICFTRGTRLRCPGGDRAVEDLVPGDRILTRDDGPQEVLWIGSSHVTGARLHVCPDLRPIRIRAAALGDGLPEDTLLVSPRHRVLLRGRAALALFNTEEVLVAAADLLDDRHILRAGPLKGVTYYHLLLSRHQVVWANGVASESFHPGEMSLDRIEPGQRAGLLDLFPDLAARPHLYGAPARRLLTSGEAAILRADRTPRQPH